MVLVFKCLWLKPCDIACITVLYSFFKPLMHPSIMVRLEKSKPYRVRGRKPVIYDALAVGFTVDSLPTFDNATFNRIYGKISKCLGHLKGNKEKGKVIRRFCSGISKKYDMSKIENLGNTFNQIVEKYSKGIQSKKIAESPRFVKLEVKFANYAKALLTGSSVLKTNSKKSDFTDKDIDKDISSSVTAAANYRWCLAEMKGTLKSLKRELKSLY